MDGCSDEVVSQVREELPLLLQNTLNAHGAQTLSVSKFIPSIVAGLSDSQVMIDCSGYVGKCHLGLKSGRSLMHIDVTVTLLRFAFH